MLQKFIKLIHTPKWWHIAATGVVLAIVYWAIGPEDVRPWWNTIIGFLLFLTGGVAMARLFFQKPDQPVHPPEKEL